MHSPRRLHCDVRVEDGRADGILAHGAPRTALTQEVPGSVDLHRPGAQPLAIAGESAAIGRIARFWTVQPAPVGRRGLGAAEHRFLHARSMGAG